MSTGSRCLQLFSYIKLIIFWLQGVSCSPRNFPVINCSWDWFLKWECICHCLECFKAALPRSRTNLGGSEKTKSKLPDWFLKEPEGLTFFFKQYQLLPLLYQWSVHLLVYSANNICRHTVYWRYNNEWKLGDRPNRAYNILQIEQPLSEMFGTRSVSDLRVSSPWFWNICIYIMRHLGDGNHV
jgi:hypothetical protein